MELAGAASAERTPSVMLGVRRHTARFPLCLRESPPEGIQPRARVLHSLSLLSVPGTGWVGHRRTDQLLQAMGSRSNGEDGCRHDQ